MYECVRTRVAGYSSSNVSVCMVSGGGAHVGGGGGGAAAGAAAAAAAGRGAAAGARGRARVGAARHAARHAAVQPRAPAAARSVPARLPLPVTDHPHRPHQPPRANILSNLCYYSCGRSL